MQNNFDILIQKIDGFIRKYYINQILKGTIYSFSLILSLFLVVDVIEYFAWSGILFRTVLFYTFSGITIFLVLFYIIIPGIKLFKIGKIISDEEAARLIGKHFPEVSDKLLNTLQLNRNVAELNSNAHVELLLASIEQKASGLKPIPFTNAVDMKKNVRYLRYFLPPLAILVFILLISPAFVTGPSERILNHRSYFEKPLPYQLVLMNENLEVLQHEDFILQVKAEGEALPAEVFLDDGYFQYKMLENKVGEYEYTFAGIDADRYFQLKTEEYVSPQYHLKVLPKPVIFNFEIDLNYPDYLSKKKETVLNSGDLVVPEGTIVTWKIYTRDADKVMFKKNFALQKLDLKNGNMFLHQETAQSNFFYSLSASNEFVQSDSMTFTVQVVPDKYPTISIDKTDSELYYDLTNIQGIISDDYGFYSLEFYYKKENNEGAWKKTVLNIDKSIEKQRFNFNFNNSEMDLSPGESLEYYFLVRDNDAVNGFKKTKSASYFLRLPGTDEIKENVTETSDQLKNKMDEAIKQLNDLNKQLEEAQLSLFQKNELSWLDKSKIQDLLNQQLELQQNIQQLNQRKDQINQMNQMIDKNNNPELQEKLNQLQQLFENMDKKDLEKQLEELKKSLENIDKDKISKMLEEMKKENEQLSGKMDQNLELFKQLELEQKIQQIVEDLEKLAEEQISLGEKTLNDEIKNEASLKEQKEITNSFSEIEKDLQEAGKMNADLEQPLDLEMDALNQDSIHGDMDQASENLEKGKENKAGQNQKSAGNKMQKMANGLNMMMQSAMQSRMGEDAEKTKVLLDNIMDLSFAQENLLKAVENTSINDPSTKKLTLDQKSFQDDFVIIQDSLTALSKRQVMIQPFILQESASVSTYMQRALESLQNNRMGPAQAEQQYATTSLNNLALMLEESLEKMQKSMNSSGQMSGNQSCPNPGNSPGNMNQMMQMQKQLNEGMNKQSKEKGLQGSEGLNGQSEELARMAAAQSEIRKLLQQYLDELESSGGNGDQINKLIDEMKKSEDEIVNRKITRETLERQKDIEVRLLQSDKAQQEREKENKRESNEGKNRIRSNQNLELKYNELNLGQDEILMLSPVSMNKFYKDYFKKYIYKLEMEHGEK